MPDLPVYECSRTATTPSLDGTLTDPAWEAATWTTDFVPIHDGPTPRYRTRAKLMYDDRYLYVGGQLEEPHVWSTMTEKNSKLFHENNFELFLDPDGDGQNYYEFEISPLGTIWELTLLPKPYVDGGVPIDPTNLPGLRTAVHVDGTVNDPSDIDDGWSVELAVPWADLAAYNEGRATPPNPGDEWRMNLMRCEWPHEVVDGSYVKGEQIEFWVWSAQGIEDMHRPATWGLLRF